MDVKKNPSKVQHYRLSWRKKKKGKFRSSRPIPLLPVSGPIRKTERNRERRDNNGVKKAREAWVELRENVHSRFLHHDLVTYCVTLNIQYK